MRRLMLALALAAVALGAAACSRRSAPGWTYAPPTAVPLGRCVRLRRRPATAASAAPSGERLRRSERLCGAVGLGRPVGGAGTTVQVSALNIAFEQPSVTAPADTAVHDRLREQGGVPAQRRDQGRLRRLGVQGRHRHRPDDRATTRSRPLAAGAYTFICTVHPTMTGTLTAELTGSGRFR